jgi:crotonobetainyl-CoA:carnitine CoA-transferase CaiB-like acyl-CoA transferase
LAVINPRIVTCSVTGFGETGPQPDRPAFDMVAQGMGGGMSITGEVDGRALRAGIPIGDLGGGVFGAMGVLAALHARERTGRGQHIDVSMLDVQISMLNYMATMFLLSGKNPGPVGNGHFVHVPYDTFRTQSRGIILAVITDNFWTSLVELLDDPELRDPRYETQPGRLADREFINRRIQAAFDRDTCEVWIERLQGKRIPCAPVNDFEHALGDPQVTARNMIVRVDHPDGGSIEMPGNPLKLSETHAETFTPPPLVGQHTNEILHAILGLSEAEISSLKQRGIVG